MATQTDDPRALLTDGRLTTVCLLFEAAAGVHTAVDGALSAHGVSGSAFEVMVRLARSPHHRLRMSDLAAQSTLSNSGLTRVVDRLLAAGYVERARHHQDRRGFYAVLTADGHELVESLLPDHLATVDEIITSVLTEEELQAFTAALRKVRAVVKPSADPNAPAPDPDR